MENAAWVGCKERSELHRWQHMVAVVCSLLPLREKGLGMRGKVSHMVAVHGAALVAPYGGGLFG